ncbi:CopG family transcriptional regulator [Pseudarthrobacter sp. NPDC080039]|uniref:CopG family transcriptional regulator n=1 Tax=unclassified Pseudarthrobacter TaxID=2647000 RepID=UPI003450484C
MPAIAQQQIVRLNVNMNEQTATDLKELAERDGLSFTETIRRAVAIYKYIRDEVRKGRVVMTQDPDGRNRREIVLM